jgi:hypothetical protein
MSLTYTDISASGFQTFSTTTNPTATQVAAFIADAETEFEVDTGSAPNYSIKSNKVAVILNTKIKVIEYWRSLSLFSTSTSNGTGENVTWSAVELQSMRDTYEAIIDSILSGIREPGATFGYG